MEGAEADLSGLVIHVVLVPSKTRLCVKNELCAQHVKLPLQYMLLSNEHNPLWLKLNPLDPPTPSPLYLFLPLWQIFCFDRRPAALWASRIQKHKQPTQTLRDRDPQRDLCTSTTSCRG